MQLIIERHTSASGATFQRVYEMVGKKKYIVSSHHSLEEAEQAKARYEAEEKAKAETGR